MKIIPTCQMDRTDRGTPQHIDVIAVTGGSDMASSGDIGPSVSPYVAIPDPPAIVITDLLTRENQIEIAIKNMKFQNY